MRGQKLRVARIHDIVIQVREKRTAWFDPIDVLESFVEPKMRRVRLDPHAVEDENIEALQSFDRFVRYKVEIRSVCKIVEPVSDDGKLPVYYFERRNFESVTDTKSRTWIDGVRYQLRKPAAEMCWLEYVLEDSAEIHPRNFIGVDAHRPVTEVQRPDVVQAEDVIDMAMRYQNGVEALDLRPESLLPEIDRRIDENL